jgi:uncharacterized protein (DUF1499 family)
MKRIKKFLRRVVIVLLVVVIAGALYIRFYTPSVGYTDFKSFERSWTPNQYLVCPTGYCQAEIDRESPVFALSRDQLINQLQDFILSQPRVVYAGNSADGNQLYFIQRSKLLAFPDPVTVQIIELDDGKISLAIYSRSVYGVRDLGVNKDRMDKWLDEFTAKVAEPTS